MVRQHAIMIADKIEYIIMLVKLFARRFELSYMQVFRYVCLHDGIEFAERPTIFFTR